MMKQYMIGIAGWSIDEANYHADGKSIPNLTAFKIMSVYLMLSFAPIC